MSKLQIWLIIGLIAAIVIVFIVKAVQKSAETKTAAAAAQNQNTLALAALSYKQNADNINAAQHGTAYEWFESMNNAIEGFGGVWGSFSGGGGGGAKTSSSSTGSGDSGGWFQNALDKMKG